jgi:hypothetical protein
VAYLAEISHVNPACILFLLDQSGSMGLEFAGDPDVRKKGEAATDINRLLMSLVVRCTPNVAQGPQDYLSVGVIGYGAHAGVGPLLPGTTADSPVLPVSKLATAVIRVDGRTRRMRDETGATDEVVVPVPIWFDPVAEGGTPMHEAMQQAHRFLSQWAASHPASYPPVVINITDGEPDQDPTSAARALLTIGTDDGTTLLYNIHLSQKKAEPILFPTNTALLPDEHARMLYGISSVFPESARRELKREGHPVSEQARGFVFNADSPALIDFLDIGTRFGGRLDRGGRRP